MYRTDNLMVAGERELDYLCRLDITSLPTLKTSKEVSKLLVDFILRNELELNGQKGCRYATFREHDSDISFIGGFGSSHQIAKIIIDNNFNIKKHSNLLIENVIKLYDKIDVEVTLQEECVIFSLKEGYTKLEDVEYIEFVYNTYMCIDNVYYPESKILVRHYINSKESSFSVVDREDLDIDIVITLTIPFNQFNDILPLFIEKHKMKFCSKLDIDVTTFNEDTNMLIQMLCV